MRLQVACPALYLPQVQLCSPSPVSFNVDRARPYFVDETEDRQLVLAAYQQQIAYMVSRTLIAGEVYIRDLSRFATMFRQYSHRQFPPSPDLGSPLVSFRLQNSGSSTHLDLSCGQYGLLS